ncbi:MAG: hypothetical protein HOI35_06235, partial [Woeseia sp.]|nr:hypothetical protein [Woeseia sp.]
EKARELTTWISEEGPEADIELARRAARYFKLQDHHADAIINDVANSLKGWQNLARQLGMSAADVGVYETALLIK